MDSTAVDVQAHENALKGRRKAKKEAAHDDSAKKRRCISSAYVCPCYCRRAEVSC